MADAANRYSHLADPREIDQWHATFQSFDRDGGGDVDLNELGLMFRQLGQTPPESEMKAMIDAVDADSSGTVDFEEFCLLMLRMKRAATTPEWLTDVFCARDPDELAEMLNRAEEPPPVAPASASLCGSFFASRPGEGGSASRAERDESPHPPLTRELLLIITDLLPSCHPMTSLSLAGHGLLCGPFVASELGRALARVNRTLTRFDLSCDNIGDEGAAAMADVILRNPVLASLHLSSNNITNRGGTAILTALRDAPRVPAAPPSPGLPPGSSKSSKRKGGGSKGDALPPPQYAALRELRLEGNAISADLHAAIMQQLLLNNLPRLFRESLTAAPPPVQPKRGKKAAPTHQTIHDSLQPGVVREAVDPAATISQAWLTEGHAAALLVELLGAAVACLVLRGCPRLGGAGVAALLAPMPPPSPLSKLVELRISNCEVDDVACTPLARAIHSGNMSAIRTLHLDHNRLTLGAQSLDAGAHIDLSEAAPESMAEVRQRDHAAPHTATVHAYSPPPCRLQSTSTTPHTAHLRNASHSALPCLAHRSSLHCPRAPLPACCRCSAPLSADSPT